MKCEEIFAALELLEKERGIPQDFMMDKIIQALTTAYKRDHEGVENVIVDVDEETAGPADVRAEGDRGGGGRTPAHRDLSGGGPRPCPPSIELGDMVNIPVENVEFGRIAAGNGKQVIIQGLREAEHGMIYDEWGSKEHEILTGTVHPHRPPQRHRASAHRHRQRGHRGPSELQRAGPRRGAYRGTAGEGLPGGGPPHHPGSPGDGVPDPSGPGEAPV